ncbi:hypothetical protein NOF04DRAFT_1271571 [Fusarium oxysporum II5]|nr:hypothetical protein NOF04DRAFT_1271571 [Fusarium oxysporum II5]
MYVTVRPVVSGRGPHYRLKVISAVFSVVATATGTLVAVAVAVAVAVISGTVLFVISCVGLPVTESAATAATATWNPLSSRWNDVANTAAPVTARRPGSTTPRDGSIGVLAPDASPNRKSGCIGLSIICRVRDPTHPSTKVLFTQGITYGRDERRRIQMLQGTRHDVSKKGNRERRK